MAVGFGLAYAVAVFCALGTRWWGTSEWARVQQGDSFESGYANFKRSSFGWQQADRARPVFFSMEATSGTLWDNMTPASDHVVTEAGWPMIALRCQQIVKTDPRKAAAIEDRSQGGIFLGRNRGPNRSAETVIPLTPMWGGLTFNSVAFALGTFVLIRVVKGVLLRRRLAAGRCPHCSYSTTADLCSECGLPIPAAPMPVAQLMRIAKPYAFAALTIAASWFGMQAAHELGHIVATFFTGGHVLDVALHPLEFSRTEVTYGFSPLTVIWMGPIVGVAVPLAVWLIAAARCLREAFVLKFFAGFCCIANGAYIGLGSFDGVGDAGDMMRHGCPQWTLIAFGIVTVPVGFWFWHGLAPRFGIGRSGDPVRNSSLLFLVAALIVLLTLAFWVGGIAEPSI